VLSGTVLAFGELRPVQCKSIADKPLAKIGAAGRTRRDRSLILVEIDGHATHRTPRDEGVKIVRRPRATLIP